MRRFSVLSLARMAQVVRRAKPSFVRETGMSDCGVAAALTCLRLHGVVADPLTAKAALDPGHSGASLEDIRAFVSEQTGQSAQALAIPADELQRFSHPVVLHFRQLHFVVLLARFSWGTVCFDPAVGPVVYPNDDFQHLYSGYCVDPGASNVAVAPQRATWWPDGAASALLGAAARCLETALLLAISALLFLILNQADQASLLTAVIVAAAMVLMLAGGHAFRGRSEYGQYVGRVRDAFQKVLLPLLRRQDLLGFRGGRERFVAQTLRTYLLVGRPPRSGGVAFGVGRAFASVAFLAMLHPLLVVVYVGFALVLRQFAGLHDVHLGRTAPDGRAVRYFETAHVTGGLVLEARAALFGEAMKWLTIGTACLSVLNSDLQATGVMFWILFSMQLLVRDFKGLVPSTEIGRDVTLLAPSVPVRDVFDPNKVCEVEWHKEPPSSKAKGLRPWMTAFESPDLTVREHRRLAAAVTKRALSVQPHRLEGAEGRIRIFGPGHEAASPDIAVLSSQLRTEMPVGFDWVARCLFTCEAADFPVFLDLGRTLGTKDVLQSLKAAQVARVAVLTMDSLEVFSKGDAS